MDANEFEKKAIRSLENVRDAIQGIEEKDRMKFKGNVVGRVKSFINQDGSVDVELVVESIPSTLSVNKLLTAIERHLDGIEDAYYQTGVRYKPRDGEPFYTKFGGLSQAESYYHGSHVDSLATGKKINLNMIEKHRRKPQQVFIRIHWSPDGKHPKVRWQT